MMAGRFRSTTKRSNPSHYTSYRQEKPSYPTFVPRKEQWTTNVISKNRKNDQLLQEDIDSPVRKNNHSESNTNRLAPTALMERSINRPKNYDTRSYRKKPFEAKEGTTAATNTIPKNTTGTRRRSSVGIQSDTKKVDGWKDFDLILDQPYESPNWAISPLSTRSPSVYGSPSSNSELIPRRSRRQQQHQRRSSHILPPPTINVEEAENDDDAHEDIEEGRPRQQILPERTRVSALVNYYSHVTSRRQSHRSQNRSRSRSGRSVARSLLYDDDDDNDDGSSVSTTSSSSSIIELEPESNHRIDDSSDPNNLNHRQDRMTLPTPSWEEDRESVGDSNGSSRLHTRVPLDDVAEVDGLTETSHTKANDESKTMAQLHCDVKHSSVPQRIGDSMDFKGDETPSQWLVPTRRVSAGSREGTLTEDVFRQAINIMSPPHEQQFNAATSFLDWIDDLSAPVDNILSDRVAIRRRTDFERNMVGAPLDYVRSQQATASETSLSPSSSFSSSSSIESEDEMELQDSKDVTCPMKPESINKGNECRDGDSRSETSIEASLNESEGFAQTASSMYFKVDGKTILYTVPENPAEKPRMDEDGNSSFRSPFVRRRERWEEMENELAELKWRLEKAEVEKQKYQNQNYGIRKKFDARVTPFRDVFEEVCE